MKKLIELIESFKDDREYYQDLYTVFYNIKTDDYSVLQELLQEAISNNKKLSINDSKLNEYQWDSIDIDNIILV